MSSYMNHWYSNEWCHDEHECSQDELQAIAKMIRQGCKVKKIERGMCAYTPFVCTIYENKNLGLTYWVKDSFGTISEIDEEREC